MAGDAECVADLLPRCACGPGGDHLLTADALEFFNIDIEEIGEHVGIWLEPGDAAGHVVLHHEAGVLADGMRQARRHLELCNTLSEMMKRTNDA